MTGRLGLALCLAAALAAAPVRAAERDVAPGGLPAALAAAAPGDLLRLLPGDHPGGVVIDKPLTLEGVPDAAIQGTGQGNVVKVTAPDVALRGLTIRNSGLNLEAMDAGVFLDRTALRAVVEDNRFEDNLFGVYVWGAAEAVVRRNVIVGRRDLRTNERGNGVQLWNAPGAQIVENDISQGRDGIFVATSRKNRFIGNRMTHLRFAIHYMYANDSEVSGNVSRGNDVGYALMYSSKLVIRGNLSQGDRDHGFALNYANESDIAGNMVKEGGHKCVFIYNSNKNNFQDNWFEGCAIGIHFTAGSERNIFSGNAFIGNQTQVMYVGTRSLDWSDHGRGNYWSDNAAFDLDHDGIADSAYRPNDIVDRVVWAVPLAKLLLNSPAVQVVGWAQSQFPAVTPGGVIDSAPLMKPPAVNRPVAQGEMR